MVSDKIWSIAVPLFLLVAWSGGIWFGTMNMNIDTSWHERHATIDDEKQANKNDVGWRWVDESAECIQRSVDIPISALERSNGTLSRRTLRRALNAFKRCGVIILRQVLRDTNDDAQAMAVVDKARDELNDALEPYLQSRQRVRQALTDGVGAGLDLDQLYARVSREPMFAMGDRFRERNDGRIDVDMSTSVIGDGVLAKHVLTHAVLSTLLGSDVRIDSASGVIALPGATDQHWHRDTPLLFEQDGVDGDDRVHKRHGGAHLPPFAINAFVPLVDRVDESNGATEFTLASHRWGDIWREENESEAVDKQFTLEKGDVLLFDLRTVHRGRANRSKQPRPLLMIVYGRSWWHDPINYVNNYGGIHQTIDNDKQRAMFDHLTRLWFRPLE